MEPPAPQFPPLPVRVRRFHGEDVMSYAHRLAEANGATPAQIERTVRYNGYPLPAGRESEERKQLWRHLGALSPEAFTEPVTFEGDEVVARPLCLRCCAGQVGRGRLPYTGWVCARHRRWIGPVQYDVRGLPGLVAAEQRFRRVLAPRAVVVDSPVYRLAGQAAGQAVERTRLDQRARQVGFDAPPQELLVYPETVRLACLITDFRFLDAAFTRSPEQQRVEFVTAQVERVLAGHEGAWLAVNPIWQMLHLMYARVRDAELRGGLVADYPWGITRFWRAT